MGRELTPAQHALIRRQLAMIPVYIWVVYSWVHVLVRIPQDEPVRDFAHFYTQGVIALERDAASLYDIDRMADVAQRVLPGHQRVLYPPVYGPQMSLLFRPLAMLPYVPARHLWLVITLIGYGACTYAIWRVCPRLRNVPGTTALLLIAAPALHYVAGFLQVSVLGLVCVTGAYLALRANRPFVAGLALGSLAYKPPLAIGVGLYFSAAHCQKRLPSRSSISTAASEGLPSRSSIFTAASEGWSPARWSPPSVRSPSARCIGDRRSCRRTSPRSPNCPTSRMRWSRTSTTCTRGVRFSICSDCPARSRSPPTLIASAITLAGAVLCWLSTGPLALRFSALLIATVLVDPHLYAYDLVVLIPGFLVLWDWVLGQPERRVGAMVSWPVPDWLRTRSFTSLFVWLLYICYLSPLFVTLADVGRIQLSPILLGVLLVVILGVLRGEQWRSPVAT